MQKLMISIQSNDVARLVIRVRDDINNISLSRVFPVRGSDRSCLPGSSGPNSSSSTRTTRPIATPLPSTQSSSTTPSQATSSPTSRGSSTLTQSDTSFISTLTSINNFTDPLSTSPTSANLPQKTPNDSSLTVFPESQKATPVGAIVGGTVGGLGGVLGLILLWYYCRRRRRHSPTKGRPPAPPETQQNVTLTPFSPTSIPTPIASPKSKTMLTSSRSSFLPRSRKGTIITGRSMQQTSTSALITPSSDSPLTASTSTSPVDSSAGSSHSTPPPRQRRQVETDAGPLPSPEVLPDDEDDRRTLPPNYGDVFGRMSRLADQPPESRRPQNAVTGASVKSPHS
ncbi:hypothetical protein BJ165DRAFT_1611362 [Panaeolus papilionaceus]|nr:hypothetical protein BJ165DRAFT_1611362 [Panaeolus papilionaceus]